MLQQNFLQPKLILCDGTMDGAIWEENLSEAEIN